MSGVQDQLEIKFRLTDGSDIGPKSFPAAASVANLKESILAQWPKGDGGLSFVDVSTSRPLLYNLCSEVSVPAKINLERENGPRTVKDVKLISAGRILENNRTVGECRSALCDIPGGVTTMHVVVQPLPPEKEKKAPNDLKQNKCVCVIL